MGSERPLSSIISNESPALFGISTGSGNIETNGTNHDVLNVNTGKEDAGRLYLLVKGANGTRNSCSCLEVKDLGRWLKKRYLVIMISLTSYIRLSEM